MKVKEILIILNKNYSKGVGKVKNKKWLTFFMLIVFLGIGLANKSIFLIFLMATLLGVLFLRKNSSYSFKKILIVSITLFIVFSLLTNHLFLMFLLIIALFYFSKNPEIISVINRVLSDKKKDRNEFIIVQFSEEEAVAGKIVKNKWLGADHQSEEAIYSWEDLNYIKSFGNSTFDLGNTLLPREQNIILIRQLAGKIKILIPEGTAISLDLTSFVGTFKANSSEYNLLNENLKWHSKNYHTQERKIKITINLLVGELEVVFI